MSIDNIKKVVGLVNEIDKKEGLKAYWEYNRVMNKYAKHFGFDFCQTVAAFVSLSPNNSYDGNLRALATLMDSVQKRIPLEEIKTGAYRHCLNRAYNYLTGKKDFLYETKGMKIKSFYYNIINPEDKRFVTIDGHMCNVWHGQVKTMKEVAIYGFDYQKIADDFITVARKEKLIPNQLQAMLWFTWKRINNIVYDAQVSLFGKEDDTWGIHIEPNEIKLFM